MIAQLLPKSILKMMQQKLEEETHKLNNEVLKTRPKSWIVKNYCKCTLWRKDYDTMINCNRYINNRPSKSNYLLDKYLIIDLKKCVLS